MSKKKGSVEDLFGDLPEGDDDGVIRLSGAPTSAPKKSKPSGGLDALFGDMPGGPDLPDAPENTPESRARLKTALEPLMAAPLGAIDHGTAGYGRRLFTKSMKDLEDRNPISAGAGGFAGSLVPGMAAAKGVGLLSKLPGLSSLANGGIRTGMAAGGLEGFASDPGEGNGDDLEQRMARGGLGALFGGIFQKAGQKLTNLNERARVYDQITGEKTGNDFSKELLERGNEALEKYMEIEVKPRKKQLAKLLENETVKIDPRDLMGFKGERTNLQGKPVGGLDRLAKKLLAKPPGPPGSDPYQREIPAKMAQRLKQWADGNVNYGKGKIFSDQAQRKETRMSKVADHLRRKVSKVDSMVDSLNDPMSEALKNRRFLKESLSADPIATFNSGPFATRGQTLKEVDRVVKKDLQKMAQNVRAARDSEATAYGLVNAPSRAKEILKGTGRVAGRTAGLVTKHSPEGATPALINEILTLLRTEEEE